MLKLLTALSVVTAEKQHLPELHEFKKWNTQKKFPTILKIYESGHMHNKSSKYAMVEMEVKQWRNQRREVLKSLTPLDLSHVSPLKSLPLSRGVTNSRPLGLLAL